MLTLNRSATVLFQTLSMSEHKHGHESRTQNNSKTKQRKNWIIFELMESAKQTKIKEIESLGIVKGPNAVMNL
jgi:hypothetical protein